MVRRAFDAWIACVAALVIREAELQFGRKGGVLVAMLEPIGLVVAITYLHYFIGANTAPYGKSVVVFFATGILYHFTFMWISMPSKAVMASSPPFPRIQPMDFVLANGFLQFTLMLGVMIFVFGGLSLYDVPEAWPWDPINAFLSFLFVVLFGIGVGIINAVVVPLFHAWRLIYSLAIRAAMIMSGVFFIPDFLAPNVRYWLSWMPLLHGISWFRAAFSPGYPTLLLDKNFFIVCTISTLTVGAALEYVTRQQRALS